MSHRLSLLLAAFLVSCTFSSSAHAQFGMSNFGNQHDQAAEIQAERDKLKEQHRKYSQPAQKRPKRPMAPHQGIKTNPIDGYGRSDLSGRAVPHYPSSRDRSSSQFNPRAMASGPAIRSTPRRPTSSGKSRAYPRARR
jgi:hypothetical protein